MQMMSFSMEELLPIVAWLTEKYTSKESTSISYERARQFMEAAEITGIILTKLDGTAKGGIAVAIQSELGIPVKYVGVGEKIDDLQKFDSHDFVNALFQTENKGKGE